jgi:hypothetical protein
MATELTPLKQAERNSGTAYQPVWTLYYKKTTRMMQYHPPRRRHHHRNKGIIQESMHLFFYDTKAMNPCLPQTNQPVPTGVQTLFYQPKTMNNYEDHYHGSTTAPPRHHHGTTMALPPPTPQQRGI